MSMYCLSTSEVISMPAVLAVMPDHIGTLTSFVWLLVAGKAEVFGNCSARFACR
jgi:hypothetical protein